MNKKILFGIMSLAALASCTTDDFESNSNSVAESSPIKFEVINNVAGTRAHMDGNSIVWDANDGDLFTLYHGGTLTTSDPILMNGYENATYTASAGEGAATLSTPSMIKAGSAIMVWPVDTTFYATTAGKLTVKVPALQENIEKNIPYASDVVDIAAYTETAAYNTAGLNRTYPIYMRPLASQLILHADYANTDAAIKALENDANPIDPITWKGVELITGASTAFTKEIGLKFTVATGADNTRWDAGQPNNAWSHVTDFNLDDVTKVNQLTSKCITDLESAKFLMLPQADIAVANASDGVAEAAVVVNTNYGKVYIAANGVGESKYTLAESTDAWYRYQAAGSTNIDPQETETTTKKGGDGSDKNYVRYTSKVALGMAQVINAFSKNKTTKDGSIVKTEPTGAVGNRYVKVLLTHLDMSALHITSDKQLSDAARVWKAMNLDDVTVYLDGDANGEFKISQTTIQTINDINGSIPGAAKSFKVKPCTEAGEECTDIVITGGDKLKDIAFIVDNATTKCNVVLNAGETWKWNIDENKVGSVKVRAEAVARIINKGTLVSDATATLKTKDFNGTKNNVPLQNDNIWNIDGGILNVQFTVNNNGTVNIAKGAQYRQDGNNRNFINNASDVPTRFGGDDSKIGVVNNKGVFATVNDAKIQNRGLINHDDVDAKTYITTNETTGAAFSTSFGSSNKKGMIILRWDNRFEDNVSVSAAATAPGFVAVETANSGVGALTDAAFTTGGTLSTYVNYIMINGDVTEIQGLSDQFKYVEIHQAGEVAWKTGTTSTYTGLMVLSDVNIKLGTTVSVTGTANNGATYLGADMYVGGVFTTTTYNGYYGNTSGNVASMYITY